MIISNLASVGSRDKLTNARKRPEEEVILDTGIYNLEYANDMNVQSFIDANKTLQYGNGELLTQFEKTCSGNHNNLWRAVVEKD